VHWWSAVVSPWFLWPRESLNGMDDHVDFCGGLTEEGFGGVRELASDFHGIMEYLRLYINKQITSANVVSPLNIQVVNCSLSFLRWCTSRKLNLIQIPIKCFPNYELLGFLSYTNISVSLVGVKLTGWRQFQGETISIHSQMLLIATFWHH
jgi:hypothetical protein